MIMSIRSMYIYNSTASPYFAILIELGAEELSNYLPCKIVLCGLNYCSVQ